MSETLLETKFYILPLRPNLVRRPQLLEQLNRGLALGCKLTLLCAPAGYGKTTLVAQWLHHAVHVNGPTAIADYECAWISLDEGDNDLARFMGYLLAALGRIDNNLGQAARSLLQGPMPPLEPLMTLLINDLANANQQFLVVLDDYHMITADPIHEAVAYLLDHQPPNLHLVIATRTEPPLPIALLRGRGQLSELQREDLRFTEKEAMAFLIQNLGRAPTEQEVRALAARTEGWAAGLQLAAFSLRNRGPAEGPSTFVQVDESANRFVIDYLAEEVFDRQPAHIQNFLLLTAVLDRLSAPLCDALMSVDGDRWTADRKTQEGDSVPTGSYPLVTDDSQAILEYLDQSNIFVVSLDDRRRWYRYHQLFADLLLERLQRVYPDQVPVLHLRASEWFEQQSLLEEAIGHAQAAADYERMARLIEGALEAIWKRSEVATFLKWVTDLPDDVLRRHPVLGVFYGLALVMTGGSLNQAVTFLQEAAQGESTGEAAVVSGLIAALSGDASQAVGLSQQALDLIPPENLFLRSVVSLNLAIATFWTAEVGDAIQMLDRATGDSLRADNLMAAVVALCNRAELTIILGRLNEAAEIYEEALKLAVDGLGRPLPIAGIAYSGLGELNRERNDLEVAKRHVLLGIELSRQWGEIGALDGYITLAHISQAMGDVKGAGRALHSAQELAARFDASEIDDIFVSIHQVHLAIAQGRMEAAMEWLMRQGLDEEPRRKHPTWYLDELQRTTAARIYLAQGQPREALALLRPIGEVAEAQGRNGSLIENLNLQALALHQLGESSAAVETLSLALQLAEPEGYTRVFLDEGQPMIQLLRQAAGRPSVRPYAGKLLLAKRLRRVEDVRLSADPGIDAIDPLPPPAELLSERELQVLQLIASGLSNHEIALRLVVAKSTVKTHINHIYRKLAVTNRTQAVARARKLDLL